MNIPLCKKGDKDNYFYLSAYKEIFLNVKSAVFGRNRLFGGIG
ncbi:MAG: hypothetical protein ACI825_000380 [Planctomycetota bacterium]|jgi:hypothetical protein